MHPIHPPIRPAPHNPSPPPCSPLHTLPSPRSRAAPPASAPTSPNPTWWAPCLLFLWFCFFLVGFSQPFGPNAEAFSLHISWGALILPPWISAPALGGSAVTGLPLTVLRRNQSSLQSPAGRLLLAAQMRQPPLQPLPQGRPQGSRQSSTSSSSSSSWQTYLQRRQTAAKHWLWKPLTRLMA